MTETVLEAVLDSLKLLPFLFITYLLMEYIENRQGERIDAALQKTGRTGPLIGSALGLIPQCGFSAAASSLYAGKVITLGTLIAVFLSTSDEMLPVMIAQAVSPATIGNILLTKFIFGICAGFIIDAVRKAVKISPEIDRLCVQDNCRCEEGNILTAALKHTVKVYIFILAIMIALNVIIAIIGEETIASTLTADPAAVIFISGAVGLIPNCSASVLITQLYIEKMITAGSMISGLLSASGVGLLVLFRTNRKNIKSNISITVLLYLISIGAGFIVSLSGITY